jgi:hypothetical protein
MSMCDNDKQGFNFNYKTESYFIMPLCALSRGSKEVGFITDRNFAISNLGETIPRIRESVCHNLYILTC